jgi:protein-tyrosine phosphatase
VIAVIDAHCHLLPGVDDGPGDVDATLTMARAQVAAGIHKVVCTPHVNHGYPANTAAAILTQVQTLREQLHAASIPLRIQAGAEVALSRAIELPDDELTLLHLGASEWLLLEPPLAADVPRIEQLIQGLQARGHRILIAHPERCAAFHHDPKLLTTLIGHGALAQVTATSLTGQFGRTVTKLARTMVNEHVVHVIASDAHDTHRRAPGLATPLHDAGFGWLTDWACHDVPRAMLASERIPPRPTAPHAARRSLRRRSPR